MIIMVYPSNSNNHYQLLVANYKLLVITYSSLIYISHSAYFSKCTHTHISLNLTRNSPVRLGCTHTHTHTHSLSLWISSALVWKAVVRTRKIHESSCNVVRPVTCKHGIWSWAECWCRWWIRMMSTFGMSCCYIHTTRTSVLISTQHTEWYPCQLTRT